MRRVVMFSGGVGSWAAAKRVAEWYGTADLTLLFTDTLMEDADLYRFLEQAAANVGGQLVRLVEGRNPWQVYFDERIVPGQMASPCTHTLKQDVATRWLVEHCDPADTVVYVGIDWSEEHRYTKLRGKRLPWRYEAPMCEAPYLTKSMMLERLRYNEGIDPPALYSLGFAHNNCSGWCCKAGIGHFAHLLKTLPKRYAYFEAMEEMLRQHVGTDRAVLRDRSNGEVKPLTLRALRERIESGGQVDMFEIGGCGCFSEV